MNTKSFNLTFWVACGLCLFLLAGCKSDDEPKPVPKGVAETPSVEPSEEDVSLHSLLKAKVRYVVGDVNFQRKQTDWKKLNVGSKIVENDKVRTAVESSTDMIVSDGSMLKIAEKTNVLFTAEMIDGKKKWMLVDISEGRVHFDIQKQVSREFKFKTGVATVAIRGTAGFVGNVHGKSVASLKEGKIDVTSNNGKTNSIVKNQTILVDESGKMSVLKLASSGTAALSDVVDSLASADVPAPSLEKNLKTFDDAYAKVQKAFEAKLQFRATPVGDTLFVPAVTLTARVTPGIFVTVWGETDSIGANGIYQRTFTWDDSTYGTKRFLATCGDGHVEVPCYMWVTEYAAVPAVQENANDAAAVTDSSAEEAKSATEDAKTASKNLSLSVKVDGGRNQRVHLDLPATELNTNLKFSLAGIANEDLDQLTSVEVLRNGKPFKKFGASDLTSLSYEVPVTIARNKIADFEVVATLKNGKKFRAKKTYEVYCLVTNHPGGKARNSILPPDQEYERLKQSGGITHE